MTSVGIQRLPDVDVDAEVMEAVDRERGSERDCQEQHREGPDQVKESRDDPVGPAAVVTREQCEQDSEDGADQRRSDPDLERVDAAVEQADRHVTAEIVGAKDVLTTRVPELRPDRNPSGDEHAVDEAALRNDLNLLAVAGEGLAEVALVRPRLRNVGGVDRRERARDHDGDEHKEE